MMKYFLGLVVAVNAVMAAHPECAYEHLKSCITLETLIAQKKWPQNIADVTNVCGQLKDGDECVSAFNGRCVKSPIAQSIADQIHTGLVKYYNKVCRNDEGKKDFLNKTLACYGVPAVASKIEDTHQRYVALVEKATYNENLQLPAYCCAFSCFSYHVTFMLKCNINEILYIDLALRGIFEIPFHEVCKQDPNYFACIMELNPAQQKDFWDIIFDSPQPTTKYENALPTLYEMFYKKFN